MSHLNAANPQFFTARDRSRRSKKSFSHRKQNLRRQRSPVLINLKHPTQSLRSSTPVWGSHERGCQVDKLRFPRNFMMTFSILDVEFNFLGCCCTGIYVYNWERRWKGVCSKCVCAFSKKSANNLKKRTKFALLNCNAFVNASNSWGFVIWNWQIWVSSKVVHANQMHVDY